MDLTKQFPRSPRAQLAGLVMLARTTDKARAHNAAKTGEYDYGCGMDRHVLGFLASNPDEFAKVVAAAPDDAAIAEWATARLRGRSPAEISTFNVDFENDAPEPGGRGEQFLHAERKRLGREDISTWFDLLDIDEKRPVPQRLAA